MMIENLPHEKNQSIYFLMGLNEIQGGKYVERKRVELFNKDVLTQNSLDAIFAKAKLLIPDWIFDLNSSSVKFGSSFIWHEFGPGSHHIVSNELLTDWAKPGWGRSAANLVQSCEIPSVCVGGRGLRGSKWYYFGSSINLEHWGGESTASYPAHYTRIRF